MSLSNPPRVYIGWDPREAEAYKVAEYSLRRRASGPVVVTPIELARNEAWGLMTRPWHMKGGNLWDPISLAPASTEFAISRFLTPLLAQTGWSLFVDCDMLFLDDVYRLFALADPRYACMCVKHQHVPREMTKMDNQIQTAYHRKNWSSVVLWNSDHQDTQRLCLNLINESPGRDLHAFKWLADGEIGELPPEWNWLVGVQRMPLRPCLAHYTLGFPAMAGHEKAEHADLWLEEYNSMQRAAAPV